MTEDLTKIPRRMRRFYRHGEPVPENLDPDSSTREPTQEDNEPWMGAHEDAPESRRSTRRNTIPQTPAPAQNTNPQPGLFGKIMGGLSKPQTTPMDHALGLHEKQSFDSRPPNKSEEAMQAKPPTKGSPSVEMQAALNELQQLAKKETTKPQANVSLSTFHFTPAGEAPRAPQGTNTPSAQNTPSHMENNSLSPRERMEQRRNVGMPQPSNAPPVRAPAQTTSPSQNTPAHIRRRMGQQIDSERMDREEPRQTTAPPSEAEDDDFKSLFGNKNKEKKKKKTGEEDDELSFDSDLGDDEELPLFEDEK